MKTRHLLSALFAAGTFAVATAQVPGPTNDANRRTAQAVRTAQAPRIDGKLDDPCWQNAPVASEFVTFAPTFGKPAGERTEVRIVYTDEAVYVGAYLHVRDAARIRTDLSRRDALSSADQFHIGLDTYRDRQNAFRFELSASGVQRDIRMSPTDFDVSWDAVWDAKTSVQADGWVAEVRIPFSALRFPKKSEQVWGLQFARQLQYDNEFSTWSPVDPNGGGAMPQWGDLAGLQNIDPPLRLAFSPYLAASLQHAPVSKDPLEYANSRSVSGGMDVKWGLSESFTLDATLIPNFGEAQSDNTVRNLSPFEVQYEERRQFFTEGTELFGKGNIFYSRRIGGTPGGFYAVQDELGPNEEVRKNPSETRLYNATKLSGRTKSKLGIGVLNAVSAPVYATIRDTETGAERRFDTAPLTNYNVLVVDQLLPNNSAIGLTNTNVLREGPARDANVSALTWNLRDRTNTYQFGGAGRLSQVFENGAQHRGYSINAGLSKVSGMWTGGFESALADRNYDQSDLGLNRRNNFMNLLGYVARNDYQPRGRLLSSSISASVENTFLQSPWRWESVEATLGGETTFRNRLQVSIFVLSRPFWYYDYFEPRVEGKKYRHAPWVFFNPRLTTDARKRLFCTFWLDYGESPIPNDPYIGGGMEPVWAVNDHFRLTALSSISKDHSNFGAVDWSNPDDIVFGRRDITRFDNSLTAEYLFTPRMNLSLRARHYWSKLYYQEYLHLEDDGTFSPSNWAGTADENFNQFNIDFVYTWQFAPGSFLNLIWKDVMHVDDRVRDDGFFKNFRKTVESPQDNTLTVKIIWWLDAGQWRKKR